MGSIKLHMEPITRTINNVTQTISKIIANFVQSILTLVTICCNSTKAKYTGEERPRVKVTQRDIELFCTTREHKEAVCHSKHSKEYMAQLNQKK